MAYIGEGLDSPSVEQNPDIAQLQAKALTASIALSAAPSTGFVDSVNGLSGLLTLQAGTSATGVTVVVTSDGVATISIGVLGITAPGVAKSNTALVPPTPSDDESMGYAIFSLWCDTVLDDVYMCADPATLAAVWRKLN